MLLLVLSDETKGKQIFSTKQSEVVSFHPGSVLGINDFNMIEITDHSPFVPDSALVMKN